MSSSIQLVEPVGLPVEPAYSLVKYNMPMMVTEDKGDDMTDEKKTYTEQDILGEIFPPREWEENGLNWRQVVSNPDQMLFFL